MRNSKLNLIEQISKEQMNLEQAEESLKSFQKKLTSLLIFIEKNEQSLIEKTSNLDSLTVSLKQLYPYKQMIEDTIKKLESLPNIKDQVQETSNSIARLQTKIEHLEIDQNSINNQLRTALEQAQPIFQQTIANYANQFRVKHTAIGLMILILVLMPLNFYMIYQSNINIKTLYQQKSDIQNNAQILQDQEAQAQAQAQRQNYR